MTTPGNDRYQYSVLTTTGVHSKHMAELGIYFFEEGRGRHEMRRYTSVLEVLDELGADGWLFSDPERQPTLDAVGADVGGMVGYPDAVASETTMVYFGKRVARF